MTQTRPTPQHPAFITWPRSAAFGRVVPKNRIYEHSQANTRLKDLFVRQVVQIVWAFKLAPVTLHLPERPGVSEIQIFRLHLKTPELHRDVLRSIDRAIPSPIVFELVFEGKTQVIAAYKRPGEANVSDRVLSGYFATDWLPVGYPRTAMPVALHLGGLYEQLLHHLIPLPARRLETLAQLVGRVEQAQVLARKLDKTTARLAREKQFNRRIEINATLRQLKSKLEQLSC